MRVILCVFSRKNGDKSLSVKYLETIEFIMTLTELKDSANNPVSQMLPCDPVFVSVKSDFTLEAVHALYIFLQQRNHDSNSCR